MLVLCLGVSHRVGSALCYWIISDKGKVISHTTIKHLTSDNQRYDYHGLIGAALGIDDFGNSFNGYENFITDDDE